MVRPADRARSSRRISWAAPERDSRRPSIRTASNVEPWGKLTFMFFNCGRARVKWASTAPGYGSGSLELERLTLPLGIACEDDDGTGHAVGDGEMPP
jgi:hypothetical protein